jgi:predicted alpha/beta hydrolase family esterase
MSTTKRTTPRKGVNVKKQVLFVQGAGAGTHDKWDKKLVASLRSELGAGYAVRYPRMPNEADPAYSPWSATLIRELGKLEPGAILVGHSVGATILVHVMAERSAKKRPAGIFLVAPPFIGEGGWPSDDIEPRADFSERLPAKVPVFLYHGDEDESVPFAHAQLYAKAIPQAVVRALEHRDHQLNDDLSEVARDILGLRARK